jgi:hypothetical protein
MALVVDRTRAAAAKSAASRDSSVDARFEKKNHSPRRTLRLA